ncbi:MAG: hypothetical protein IIY78_01915 [Clostridia bacterium]|nr:hypothetical protein [Clostridia bacterium]
MTIIVRYHPELVNDIARLTNTEKKLVLSAMSVIAKNPFKRSQGGVGKIICESGNESVLTVKIGGSDITMVYKLVKSRSTDSLLLVFGSAVTDAAPREV